MQDELLAANALERPSEAAPVSAHPLIMLNYRHRSSCQYRRSALPTFADYAAGMVKARLRKPSGLMMLTTPPNQPCRQEAARANREASIKAAPQDSIDEMIALE
jgi:hypothetical protein